MEHANEAVSALEPGKWTSAFERLLASMQAVPAALMVAKRTAGISSFTKCGSWFVISSETFRGFKGSAHSAEDGVDSFRCGTHIDVVCRKAHALMSAPRPASAGAYHWRVDSPDRPLPIRCKAP